MAMEYCIIVGSVDSRLMHLHRRIRKEWGWGNEEEAKPLFEFSKRKGREKQSITHENKERLLYLFDFYVFTHVHNVYIEICFSIFPKCLVHTLHDWPKLSLGLSSPHSSEIHPLKASF